MPSGSRATALVLASALAAAACAATLRHPTEADARAVAPRYPGTTAADLERGRSLYVRRCAGCHTVPLPGVHTPAEWPEVIGEMAARARLSAQDRADIERFLVALSVDGAGAGATAP